MAEKGLRNAWRRETPISPQLIPSLLSRETPEAPRLLLNHVTFGRHPYYLIFFFQVAVAGFGFA